MKNTFFAIFLLIIFANISYAQSATPPPEKDSVNKRILIEITDWKQLVDGHNFVKAEEDELLNQLDAYELYDLEAGSNSNEYPECIKQLLKQKEVNFSKFKMYEIAEFENVDQDYNSINLGPSTCAIIIIPADENKKSDIGCELQDDIYMIINVWGIKKIKEEKSFLEYFYSKDSKEIAMLANKMLQEPKSMKLLPECISGNCENGKGIYKLADGTVYDGDFVDSKMSGKGKLTYKNGDVYDGDFVNGKKKGTGLYTFSNGDYYRGTFENDTYNGFGLFYTKSTKDFKTGVWKDGVFIN